MEKCYCSVPAAATGSSVFRFAKPTWWSPNLSLGGYRDTLSGIKLPERDEHSLPPGNEVRNGYISTSNLTGAILT
jgi:hypothetical protein